MAELSVFRILIIGSFSLDAADHNAARSILGELFGRTYSRSGDLE